MLTGLAALALSACAATPASSPGPASASGDTAEPEDQEMASPFMLREASLPEGFPPPGPVGEVVVKRYPAYRAAFAGDVTDSDAATQDGLFRVLFKHIKRNDIAMTAPVEMTYAGGDDPGMERMAFLYRDPTLGETGEDGDVQVRDVPAMTVVSVGVRGAYTDERLQTGLAQLHEWLAGQSEYQPAGSPRYLGYNSPFVPWFMRYGEVQLPIESEHSE